MSGGKVSGLAHAPAAECQSGPVPASPNHRIFARSNAETKPIAVSPPRRQAFARPVVGRRPIWLTIEGLRAIARNPPRTRRIVAMTDKPFAHLHCHSHYSLLDGAGSIDRLVERAKPPRHERPGADGPRQSARRLGVLQEGQGRRHQAHHRLRSLHCARQPDRESRQQHEGSQLPPDAAVPEPHRVQEPAQDGFGGLPRRLLLQAADRQGTARSGTTRASSA